MIRNCKLTLQKNSMLHVRPSLLGRYRNGNLLSGEREKKVCYCDNCNSEGLSSEECGVETLQDFLIKLGIKPLMALLEISIF